MLTKKSVLVVLFCVFQICFVNCEDGEEKSSLVFVIDDTASMMGDIDQVKTQVDGIFESAYNSNASRTEDFVIVTFNDPGSKHRTTTKDKAEFKKALAEIQVHDGGDCPELAMEGLELALKHSRNGSLVYLFTDADAKDFDKYEAVKTIATQKNCKFHFILTGTCQYFDYDLSNKNKKSNDEPGHRVYFDLAEATGGQVFSQYKEEVGAILSHASAYVAGGFSRVVASEVLPGSEDTESDVPTAVRYGGGGFARPALASSYALSGRAVFADDAILPGASYAGPEIDIEPPTRTTIRPGVELKPYYFNVTEGAKDLLVSVSGFHPKVELTGPDGTAPKTEEVATTTGSKVIKILEAKPGQYTAKITSLGRTSIVISGNDVDASKAKS